MKKKIILILLLIIPLIYGFDKKAYYLTMPTYNSYKEFIRGVKYYEQERYEAAIESFKIALNYNPTDKLMRYWYSRALYKSGYNLLAVNEWRNMMRMGESDILLQSKIDKYDSVVPPEILETSLGNFVYLKTFSTDRAFVKELNQPIQAKTMGDGSLYVLDYSDNALKIFNGNGILQNKITHGKAIIPKKSFLNTIRSLPVIRSIPKIGLQGDLQNPRSFDTDIAGNIYIANTGRDIIYKYDSAGRYITNIGSRGYKEGFLSGPSSIALDNQGKLYVADTGNNRVSVFSADGQYFFSFGKMGEGEGEFFRPSGIAVNDSYIFVADTGNMRVQMFDLYGNYIAAIVNEGFRQPRGLSFANDGNLFIADGQKVFYYDIEYQTFKIFQNSTRYTATPTYAYDSIDGNIYISDFLAGRVDVYTRKENYYANLDVFIDRAYLTRYPGVVQKVTVRDNGGRPLTGLTRDNFTVYENTFEIPEIDFYTSPEMSEYRFIYLIDDSLYAKNYQNELAKEIENFTGALTGNDEVLVIHYNSDFRIKEGYESRNLRIIQTATNAKFEGNADALGQALNEAVVRSGTSFKKTSIVIFNASNIDEFSFSRRNIDEIINFAKNNGVPVDTVYVGENKNNYFLDMLAEKTQGKSLDASQSINYAEEINYLKTRNFGEYYIRYNTFKDEIKKGDYRATTVIVKYRDMYGEEEAGYIIP